MQYIDGNNYIAHQIKEGIPSAIGKIGVVELKAIYCYMNQHYTEDVIHEGQYVAGMYPYTPDEYNKFMKVYLNSLKTINALAVWNQILSSLEIDICQQIKAYPIQLKDIEPYYHNNPWSNNLKDKKILVISPFANSITRQYTIIEDIWPNAFKLPNFNLISMKYPNANTIDSRNTFKSTIEVIEHAYKQMDAIDYDITLVGVGAASIPLIAHAKQQGKIGIHMGGATQILFGVKGKRWDNIPEISKFYNKYWERPSKDETPEKVELVEGACYW